MRLTALWFVSIQPPDREQPAASPHSGALQLASKSPPVCPATPSRLPARPRFISHRTSHPHPAPCSVPRPRPISARPLLWVPWLRPRVRPTMLGFRGPVRVCVPPCLGFAALSRLWPGRACFRVSSGFTVTLFSSKAPAPSNSGLRSCLQAFRSCSPTASPVGLAFRWLLVAPAPSDLASVGFGLACLVPDLARLNSSPAPAHFLASFRSSNSAPGFSVLVATQIRPNPPIPMRHNVTLSR